MTQAVILADDALSEIGSILAQLSARRIFFVVDEGAYQASGAREVLPPVLSEYQVTTFTGFEPNPKFEDVVRGIEMFRAATPDVVIALGGGTAIDLGKLIACLACQSGDARQIAIGKSPIEQSGPPLMAIPTTAGTGSEATHFAVVYVDGDKYSLAHASLLPRFAIIDPLLTHSLPARMTAATGLDAFCQAIESIWAVGATEKSIGYASEAMRLANEHLVAAVNSPTPAARDAMCRASHLAGKAIDISKTTLSHAISYAITSEHGIPHGVAVALTLRQALAFNAGVTESDCVDPRGAEHVQGRLELIAALLGAESIDGACDRIEQLLAAIDCPGSLGQLGIANDEDRRLIVDSVNAQRLSNNPRRATAGDLLGLLGDAPPVATVVHSATS